MTNMGRHGGGIVILLSFLVALILAVMPLPDWARAFRPEWHTLVLIYWCTALPQRVGVGAGWLLGIAIDSLTGTLLGQNALGLALIAFLSIRLHQRMRVFPLWQQSLTIFLLLALKQILMLWIMGMVGRPIESLFYWAPTLVGMALCPWIFIVLHDIRRRFAVA